MVCLSTHHITDELAPTYIISSLPIVLFLCMRGEPYDKRNREKKKRKEMETEKDLWWLCTC